MGYCRYILLAISKQNPMSEPPIPVMKHAINMNLSKVFKPLYILETAVILVIRVTIS